MRWRTTILLGMLSAAIALPDVAQAQLSPHGIIGGITRPFRQALGHFGHYPRVHRHRAAAAEPQAAATTPTQPNDAATSSGSHLGWAGPPVWVNAYEDVLGFALWPDDYAARLRSRGFDLIADTISGRFEVPHRRDRIATTGAAVGSDASRCDERSIKQDNWPEVRVEQILQLSDSEHEALEKLQAAVLQSIEAVKADCGASMALAPPERLGTFVQTLWAVRDAGMFVRSPLKNFYDTLTETQKNSFASRHPQSGDLSAEAKGANASMNKQYQACAIQNSERAERLIKEIEMRVRPTRDQAASFENFHKVSSEMAKLLIASCAQAIPADPIARLDDANDQLTAINYAATTVQISFDGFYAKLDSQQKARFNSLSR